MATKGDKAVLSPQAMRLYADGITLSAISDQLGVSVTTLNIQRLRNLFEQQLSYCEDLHPSERTSREMDALAKIGSLLERWDKIEKGQRLVTEIFPEGTEQKTLTADQLKEEIKKVYGV